MLNFRVTALPSQGFLKEKSLWDKQNSINNLDSRSLEVLGCLFSSNQFQRESISSLDHIARQINCSRSTVQRSFNTIFSAGILTKKRRFNASNVYQLSQEFNTPEFIAILLRKIRTFYQELLFNARLIMSDISIDRKFDQLKKNFNVLTRWIISNVIVRRGYNFTIPLLEKPSNSKTLEINNTQTKRGVIMSYNARQEVIRQIDKKLPLTQTGAVTLQKYHANALQEGLSRIKIILGKKEPYVYLLSVCEAYSKDHDLVIDRIENDRQKIKLGIPHYDKHFVDITRVQTPTKPKPREAQSRHPEENGMSGRLPLFIPERIVDEKQVEQWQKEVATMEAPNPFFAILQQGFNKKFAT